MQEMDSKLKRNLKKRTYSYAIKIIESIDKLPRDIASVIIAKQLLRSATSVGANIAEAQGASSKRDFTNFFTHSLKSANESLYWLELLRDAKKINAPIFMDLILETREIANIIGASILTLKGKR